MNEYLSFLNVLILPFIYFIIRIEHRLTRIETKLGINNKNKKKS